MDRASILPYIHPENRLVLLQKIYHVLNPNGQFIGNFFTKNHLDHRIMTMHSKMGAWFLENEASVIKLLKRSGFAIENVKHGGQGHPSSVIFTARKLNA